MKKVVISFLLILSVFFAIPVQEQEVEASTLVNTGRLNSNTAYVGGNVSGSVKVCLRGPGNGFTYKPVVNIYNWSTNGVGSLAANGHIAPGDCISFNAGSKGDKVYQVNVARTSVSGTYYFDLYQN